MDDFTIVNKTTTLVGKRCSGKSFLLKWLVEQHKDDFHKIFVICPTETINGFYQRDGFVPPEHIFDEYSEEWTERLINSMTKINRGKLQGDETAKHVLLILDDLVADHNFHQSPSLKKLFVRGRHIFISIIITAQYLNCIPPVARINSDYVCVGQLNKAGLDILCEEYIRAGMTKEEFVDIYKNNTRNYSFLLINNNSVKTDDLNETYGALRTPEDFMEANK
jgi:hypothetical protein